MDPKILEDFGLTRNEIDIFLTLVKKGTLSPTRVAKETGLNRPYVYYALERLLEKGYIAQITEKGKKNFKVLPFTHILTTAEHKLDVLKKLGDELEQLRQQPKEDISVEVLKGKYTIKNVFKRVLTEIKPRQELLILGVDEAQMEEIEPVYLQKLLNHWQKNRITERIILRKGGRKLEYAKTATYRFFPPELIGNTARFIYQDVVIDIIYGMPIYAIIAKNALLADTARKQFEVFWKMAER